MAIVNLEKEEVLEYGFHKNLADSDAVAIETVKIDTETYVDLSKYQPFAIFMNLFMEKESLNK